MSKINTTPEGRAKAAKVELLDCGQASKVTKGFPFFILYELGIPPFNRQLIL